MPPFPRFILLCYRAHLRLYPARFRELYADEMIDVFRLQLLDQRTSGTRLAMLRTIRYALTECFTVALPERLWDRRIAISSVSLVITAAVFVSLVEMLQNQALARWVSHTLLFGG